MTVQSVAASAKRLNFSSRASFSFFEAQNDICKTLKNANLSKIKAFFDKLA